MIYGQLLFRKKTSKFLGKNGIELHFLRRENMHDFCRKSACLSVNSKLCDISQLPKSAL